ncbi:hypothetical protein Taro_051108 [Colocasia esculenta]|uniref:Uncharacterized protein n=1 Tax=Colocasia esculenta TaxID=4460 RepID=A0A843XFT2_COLES|nr:hypothetical protein [Colocasia esculenta]
MAASGSSDSVGGYNAAFLTADQLERFSAVKIKLCGNKAVDLEDLEKHGMHSVVEALQRLKWTGICTISEPNYPHLAKAFYTCLKTEEDGSLTSMVKGYNLVDLVDIHAKGLGIIGMEYKLKDGKIEINQFNAFNRILHFIKQDINMAQVIIERMKSIVEVIWDRKNKLAVSLPYAHLLTRSFSHFENDLKGELLEKMGQPIRTRNLKKSGFSLVGNVWTKTSVAEGEAIIGEASDAPPVQEEVDAFREDEPPASERRIEDIAPEFIEPVGQSAEGVIHPLVPAPAIIEESVTGGAAHTEGEHEDIHIEETPSIPIVETAMEESHEDMIPEVVALGHIEDVHMEDASAQGEPEAQEEQDVQGEPTASAPTDQFQEGLVEDTSDEDDEPVVGSGAKGKGVATGIPLLTRKAHHISRKKKIHVHLEPVIARLNAQGEILCSLQSDVTSIFLSQSTEAKDIGAVKSELQGMRSELGSLKKLVTNLSDFVRVHLTAQAPHVPTQSVPEESAGPSGPSEPVENVVGPPGASVEVAGPSVEESGPSVVGAGPSEPSEQVESVAGPTGSQVLVEEAAAPPASSSSAGPSLADPSSAGPSTQPPPTSSFASVHPPTPPSFNTIILESASIICHTVQAIKDEFEEAILCTVLSVSAHIYKTESQPSSSLASKKRKTSIALVFPSNQILFPPLWYSLSVVHRRKTVYAEYLQKCTFAATFGLPYLNLSEYLNIILPIALIPKPDQAKILSSAESKTEDLWARANKAIYIKFEVARANIFPPSDHPLTLSEWFVCQHRTSWGPFIQKEIKLVRQFQMYHDYCFVNRLPKVQLGQFKGSIAKLCTENPVNVSLQVDFATLKMPERGAPLAFHRFLFREYQRGFIKSSVLAPLLAESERFVNSDWCRVYHESALQLGKLNTSLSQSNQLTLSPEQFMDLNSINLVSDPYSIWIERYKVFVALQKDLVAHKLHYPISIDKILQHASFGTAGLYKSTLSNQEYTKFIEEQRLLHIKRLSLEMEPSYDISWGVFRDLFEEQEVKAWQLITRHASRLSSAFYMSTPTNE